MATINKEQTEQTEQTEKALQMLYETLDDMLQKGIISRELKEGGDPENPDDWLYYMDARQRGQIRDA